MPVVLLALTFLIKDSQSVFLKARAPATQYAEKAYQLGVDDDDRQKLYDRVMASANPEAEYTDIKTEQYSVKLASTLHPFKTELGWTESALDSAFNARDKFGAILPLPKRHVLMSLDLNSDNVLSEAEIAKFKGLTGSFCGNIHENFYGCESRCTDGIDEFDGSPAWFLQQGYTAGKLSSEDVLTQEHFQQLKPSGSGTSKSQQRALQAGLYEVIRNGVEGAVTEWGVFHGDTSIYLHRMLVKLDKLEAHPLHLFDSFEGLPPCNASSDTGMCEEGSMKAGQDVVRATFERNQLQPVPPMHKGFFRDIKKSEIPEKIAFAFLDGDLYESIHDALEQVYPRLQPGGIMFIHNWGDGGYPGSEIATQEFFKDKPETVFMPSLDGVHVSCFFGAVRKAA